MDFAMDSFAPQGKDHVLSLVGELDVNNASQVRQELDRLHQDPRTEGVVLDLSALHVLDSISLGVIIRSYTLFVAQDRRFVIRNPSEEISELLQISCLDQLIPIIWESTDMSPGFFV